jgi:nitrate reductase cytochrome c-type subunit
MKPWQGLLNKAPGKGEKEEQREKTQARARSAKTQCRSHKRAKKQNYVQEPSLVARSISKRRKET